MGILESVRYNLYSSPDIIRQVKSKANEVGGARGMHGRGEKSVKGFGGKARRKRDHWEDQGVGGKMGSEWILGRLAGGGGWIGFGWLRTGTSGRLL
jgi:hypothetical protein